MQRERLFGKRTRRSADEPPAAPTSGNGEAAADPAPELVERLRHLDWPKPPEGARERVLKAILPSERAEPKPEPGRD